MAVSLLPDTQRFEEKVIREQPYAIPGLIRTQDLGPPLSLQPPFLFARALSPCLAISGGPQIIPTFARREALRDLSQLSPQGLNGSMSLLPQDSFDLGKSHL